METYHSPFLSDKEKNEEPESTISLLKSMAGVAEEKTQRKTKNKGEKKKKKKKGEKTQQQRWEPWHQVLTLLLLGHNHPAEVK